MPELHDLSLTELSERIGRRDVSPVDATRHVLDRIVRLDPMLNAYVTVFHESALRDAQEAEREIAAGHRRGPLHGVPLSVKDLFWTAEGRTTAGSRVLADFRAPHDATVVARLRAAGAVLVGKTNLLEFAYGEVHPDYGPSRNPWNPEYGTSGSSSGSGASVAAGLDFGSFGSDTGGSIRGPAAFCGVAGLKPTYGLVPRTGMVPLAWSLDHAGPLARTAADCALLLQAVAGHDPADPGSARRAAPDVAAEAAHDPGPLTVGVVEPEPGDGVVAELRQAVATAADALRDRGMRTTPVRLPHPEQAARAALTIVYCEALAFHAPTLREQPEAYSAPTRERLELAQGIPATLFLTAQRARRVVVDAYRDLFRSIDLLLSPVGPTAWHRLGAPPPPPDEAGADRLLPGLRFTAPFNLTGQPALAVPVGWADNGLPLGVQLVGRPFADGTVLAVGARLQAATAGRVGPMPDL